MTKPQKNTPAFTRAALAALHTLDAAIANHLDWLKNLHRVLVCSGVANPDDLAQDAHCRCRFGQWYYGQGMADLGDEPSYLAMETIHLEMHAAAAQLLSNHDRGDAIDEAAYDAFMELAMNFKQRVRLFQYEIMNRICVVDQLTGAWNRYAMQLRLAEESERVLRGGQEGAVCMMDIDHFKAVNDNHGHQTGDKVLQVVATLLADRLRRYDGVFRFGGEEFLLCLPATTLQDAEALLNRVREELAVLDLPTPTGCIRVTASFGIALLGSSCHVEEAVARADRALLEAKASGRNRVCIWDGNVGVPASPWI